MLRAEGREIPVVVLHRIDPKPGEERVKGMGNWIVEVHDWLRKELKMLRAQADKVIDGTAETIERAPPDLAEQMRTHCLSFCGALRRHHVGEDMAVFPSLAKQFPALAPAHAQLSEQHKVVAQLQDRSRRSSRASSRGNPTRYSFAPSRSGWPPSWNPTSSSKSGPL